MSLAYPELNQRILEMAEGDEEFRMELTTAIHAGLLELKTKYDEGFHEKDEVKIQQIRHKVKPTLGMFEFEDLSIILQEGKDILESEGFNQAFGGHFHLLQEKLDTAIEETAKLLNN